MTYNREEEKNRIYEMLSESKVEEFYHDKKQLFKDAVYFALSEYRELAKSYDNFFKSVDHLVIFQYLIKDRVMKDTINMMKEIKFLIEKQYTKEELEHMPTPVYDQVLETQRQRADLLKKIAETYLADRVKEM